MKFILCMLLALFGTTDVFAREPSEGSKFLGIEPILPYIADSSSQYRIKVFDTIFGPSYLELWMIGYPSFGPEYGVGISHKVGIDGQIDLKGYVLVVSKLKNAIYPKFISSAPSCDCQTSEGGRKTDSRMFSIDQTRDIATPDAAEFIDVWHKALGYPSYSKEPVHTDGKTRHFYSNLRGGSVDSSAGGIGKLLSDSGSCLFSYATVSIKEQASVMARCKQINAELKKILK
jgi:hypothetical protein